MAGVNMEHGILHCKGCVPALHFTHTNVMMTMMMEQELVGIIFCLFGMKNGSSI